MQPHLSLIIIGLLLMFYFNLFSQNISSYQVAIKEDTMIYKTENFTKGYIAFRILQLFIAVILILASLNILRRNKKTDF